MSSGNLNSFQESDNIRDFVKINVTEVMMVNCPFFIGFGCQIESGLFYTFFRIYFSIQNNAQSLAIELFNKLTIYPVMVMGLCLISSGYRSSKSMPSMHFFY